MLPAERSHISRAALRYAEARGEGLVAEDPTLREKVATPNTPVEKGRGSDIDLTT